MGLNGEIREIHRLTHDEREQMFRLMSQFYRNMTREVFLRDLEEKDCAILLWEDNGLRGFSTQKRLELQTPRGPVRGVFSGDTIIHPESWGSMDLFQLFSRQFFASDGRPFYWFLISKGYKTYKILPAFFRTFYPCCSTETPEWEKQIMDAFGALMYPQDYNPVTGVVEYRQVKDCLREGVADVTERHRKDRHVAYFLRKNPGYLRGNDLVCLTRLSEENLLPRAARLLLGAPRC